MKKRPLSGKQLAELDQLKNWCLLFLEYLAPRGLEERIARQMREAIVDAYEGKDLIGMRSVSRDFSSWLRELPEKNQREVELQLKERANIDLSPERREELQKLRKILARGKILNSDEYLLVKERVEEVFDEEDCEDEVRRLNELLASYEASPS